MRQYMVDAFTDKVFHGNQAAVCVLEAWLPEETMLQIAVENCFSETAFLVREGEAWRLRWFTPGGEIDLCGHATLASAYVLLREYMPEAEQVRFVTLSGELVVQRCDDLLEMTFPAYKLAPVPVTDAMTAALGVRPCAAYMGRDLLCVLEEEAQVRSLNPDLEKIAALDGLLVHVTAQGSETDCVSRSFGPKLRIPEDPVCGSGHCHIVPYWAEKLGKANITAYQASARGGMLYARAAGDKVYLAGKAVLFAVSEIVGL